MSLYNLINSLNLEISSRDKMYDNIKLISNYIDTPLSKVKKDDLIIIINGLKNYLIKENNIILDEEQKLIIESPINQNQRIIAGAGSGKTTTILYRVKYLLDKFITPDRILILTFNKDSAQNIKNRINTIIGFNINIKIYTIDAFCFKLINKYYNNNFLYSLTEYCIIGLKIMKEYQKELSAQYKYIFFDEFQDVNDIQFNILKLFVDNKSYLTVIGDDCQNIYQFRGTNNYYMINFDRIVLNTYTYFLKNNYRSTENIVNLANNSILYNKFKIDKNMKAYNGIKNNPKLIINDNELSSINFILKKINYYIKKGYNYDNIAILSRNSYPLKILETELTKYNIPHVALITDKNSEDSKKLIESGKIVLTTIHKSKGLEWAIVFIVGLNHFHFPEHLNNNIKNIEEERRLFYVGITRCKKNLLFITHKTEFPLSIFLKESIDFIDVFNKTNSKAKNYFGNNNSQSNIKKIYGVNELIGLLNEIDLDNIRNLDLLPNILPEPIIKYDSKINFTENIKQNSFEPELGEYCDRYITRGIMSNLDIDFFDSDTEFIIREENNSIKREENNSIKREENNRQFNYPKNVISKIKEAYNNIKNNNNKNINLMNDIYWISICRNFKLERRRLVYRDIYNLIEENIKLSMNSESLINRMDDYIQNFTKQNNINCKVLLSHTFFNDSDDTCMISGEIDLINNDTLIDFKCSESEFKLEWLIQLLIYYSLYNNSANITKLCIINIMTGKEYLFDISTNNRIIDSRLILINYLENKIKSDQQSIRQCDQLTNNKSDQLTNNKSDQLTNNKSDQLTNNKLIINNKILQINNESDINVNNNETNINIIVFNKCTNELNTNIIILDTETSELNGDIIQLAYIIVDKDYNIIKQVDRYVKNRVSSLDSFLIHNINIDTLRTNGIEFYDIIKEFVIDLETINILVGHNINYDLRVLINNIRKFNIQIVSDDKQIFNIFKNFIIHDTCTLSNKKSLSNLYFDFFNKEIDNAHNAINDVIATFECYKYIKSNNLGS
jgi:DNA polymerase III epsilon subunit-like protein